jgi:D-lactate dehydrogenase (cytochrome)
MYSPNSAAQVKAAQGRVSDTVHRAAEMEGTVSVCFHTWTLLMSSTHHFHLGRAWYRPGKKQCLLEELGSETIAVMRTLKRNLNPKYDPHHARTSIADDL